MRRSIPLALGLAAACLVGASARAADDDAYRVYDADPEHNRIRRELFAPISSSIQRIQFAL